MPTIDVIAHDIMTDKLVSIMKQDCHPLQGNSSSMCEYF